MQVCNREKFDFLLLSKVVQNSIFTEIWSEKPMGKNFYLGRKVAVRALEGLVRVVSGPK